MSDLIYKHLFIITGRCLGEVNKFLVYNARKRQDGGDTAEKYFERTRGVAGVEDMRNQGIYSINHNIYF